MARRITPATGWGLLAVLLGGAIFGFFYAWVCSTMWGLDSIDPRVAIEAMQAMNASVRNAVFFPAFFLTPLVMAVASVVAARERRRTMSWLMAAAAVAYALGGLTLTMAVNVPMNEDLGRVVVPASRGEAELIWTAYSERWQTFNQLRTTASGLSLLLAAAGLALSSSRSRTPAIEAGAPQAPVR